MIGGVDEAGRGPCVGPLVIAGLIVEDETKLIKLGVRDSKKCSPKKREILVKKIKELSVKCEVLSISASDIDDLSKVMTLNELEVDAFSKIIDKLKPDICYVDAADVNEERFGKEILSRLSFTPTIISKHKADELYPVVGAASILAKTTRDEQIRNIEKELQKKLFLPLGSGYPADPVTQHFLRTWLKTFGDMPPDVRHCWKTTQNLIRESKTKKLDEF